MTNPAPRPRGRPGEHARPAERRAPSSPPSSRLLSSAPKPAAAPRPPALPLPTAGRALAEIEELEVTIEKLVAGGDGLARWQGVPIFVPRSAPGDRARVRIVERRPDYGRGEIVELLEPGPGRRAAPCPHFAECGGCDLQHLEDELQLRLKVAAARETLARIAKIDLAPLRILAGDPWRYRIRTQLHLAARGAGRSGVDVGYHARGTRRLVPIRECAVLEPALEEVALSLGERLTSPVPARLDLAAGDGGRVVAAPPTPPLEGGELVRRIAGHEYRFDARTFFQGHGQLLPQLVRMVVGEERGELAYDLYGGVGLFALPLAERYRRVVLVESDRIAVRYAGKNARTARLENVEVVARAVESWAGGGLVAGADRAIVDPPRDGLPRELRKLLVARPVSRLTYVSCHAAALARDLTELAAAYEVESLDFADLFPQTGHLETIVQLRARDRR